MTAIKGEVPISDAYAERLLFVFGDKIGGQLTDTLYAPMDGKPAAAVPYIQAGEATASPRSILCIEGFTETTTAKAPFVGALASRGFHVVMAGQNRGEVIRLGGDADAAHTQAWNSLAVVEASGLPEGTEPIDVVPRSWGGLVFEQMVKLKPDWFQDSRVVLCGTAGNRLRHRERIARLGGRFLVHFLTEGRAPKAFPDVEGDAMKAGMATMFANKSRSWKEVCEIAANRIDFMALLESGIGSLDLVTFPKDQLMPRRNQDVSSLLFLGASARTLRERGRRVALFADHDPAEFPALADATHNADQFQPWAVADVVAELLTAERS